MKKKRKTKILIPILIIFVLVIFVSMGVYFYKKNYSNKTQENFSKTRASKNTCINPKESCGMACCNCNALVISAYESIKMGWNGLVAEQPEVEVVSSGLMAEAADGVLDEFEVWYQRVSADLAEALKNSENLENSKFSELLKDVPDLGKLFGATAKSTFKFQSIVAFGSLTWTWLSVLFTDVFGNVSPSKQIPAKLFKNLLLLEQYTLKKFTKP